MGRGEGSGGVGGLLPLVPRGSLPYDYGGSVQGLPLQSSGWMPGCPCSGLTGFCAPWGLLVAWVWWPSLPASDCWGGMGFVTLYTYTLITRHGYHVGPVSCVSQVHAHTHTFISPVACSQGSCCVILWFEVIYIHSCVVCDCCFLCCFFCVFVFSLLVCFKVLLVALRLDSPQRPWIVFCFVFTCVAAGCLVFHC